MDYVKWIAENWVTIVQLITAIIAGVITVASIFVKLTAKTSDDEFVTSWGAKLMKFVEILSLKKK